MSRRVRALTRRLFIELTLMFTTLAVVARCIQHQQAALGLLAFALGTTGAALGVLALWRTGALAMAWWCPRLASLGVGPGSRDAPWAAMVAADRALQALDEQGGAFRSFFPEARPQLIKAARRMLDSHRLAARARAALEHAPIGPARARLEDQVASANAELQALTAALFELRARFIASTAPVPRVDDPLPALEGLDRRSVELDQARTLLERTT